MSFFLDNFEKYIKIMAENCVIYVRVSTDIQDYDRQVVELKQFALNSGLSIPVDGIFEDKLSGFKDEKERHGLKGLMDYCLKNGVKKVLIWEISRLARKHVILLNLIEFFKGHRINIYFAVQGKWLLDSKGEVSGDTGMMIAVMGWYSEYESKLMQDRFKSKKLLNESIGKYNGGKIPFGYKLDVNNCYVINDDKILGLEVSEADIVREVFDLYEKGLVCSKICRICRSKGYPKIVSSTHTLARLLRNTSYIGFKKSKLGNRPTPHIITEQQFYHVTQLINQNKTKADKGRSHVYLLRGLIKCSYCGEFYVGKQTDDGYICPKNSGSNKSNKNTSCQGGNISISNIDGIIWSRAKYWLSKWKVVGFDDENMPYTAQIVDLNDQINRFNIQLDELEKERGKLNFMFRKGGLSADEYEKEISRILNEKNNFDNDIALLESEINLIENKRIEFQSIKKRIENINSIEDRNQMKSILKSLIKEIRFYKAGLYKTVVIIDYYRGNTTECILYNSVAKKGDKFRLTYPQYIKYDSTKKIFYAIKNAETVSYHTKTDALKKYNIDEDIPEYLPLWDYNQLLRKYNIDREKITNIHYYPIPNEHNSVLFDFDTLMNVPDVEGIITTSDYIKLTYFKDLKKSRFSRKRNTNKRAKN